MWSSTPCRHHLPAELGGHGVQAVTDAQDRHVQFEYDLGGRGPVDGGGGFRPAREHDAPRGEAADVVLVCVPGQDFTVHPDLADPAGNQLRVLRTEIENQDPVEMDVVLHGCSFRVRVRMSKSAAGFPARRPGQPSL